MKRVAGYFLLGLLLFLVFLIANAPAVWLAEAATRLSNGSVTLTGPTGTFWRGSGELYAGGPATNVRHLGTLRWRVNPMWLFVARAQLFVQLDGPGTQAQATLRIGRRQMSATDLSAALPAQLITAVYPPAAFFAPTGTLEIRAPGIELSANGLIGVAEAYWRGAGGRFTANAGVGDYRVDIAGKGETATLGLKTLRGDLDLAGEGLWRVLPDGELRFNGTATPRGEAMHLEPLLRALGRDLGGGRREIRFTRRVPIVQELGFN